jgi:uncharacterized protein (DUF58 family)
MSAHPSAIRIRVARLGWQFAFIGVFAMIGGAIRAYNLPLVLAGLIVATLILQWRWVRHTIASVSVLRRLPSEAFAGQPFDVIFLCSNHSRWLAAWLIRIDDKIRRIDGAAKKDWLGRVQNTAEGQTDARCGIGVIPCGKTLTTSYTCVVTRRGRYDLGPYQFCSGAPLGLISAHSQPIPAESFYVFPARVVLTRHWRRRLQSRMGGNATTDRRSGVADGEFFGIRSWQEGDSRRWIHWRTTARIGEPAVRQFEQNRRFEVCILLDAFSKETSKPTRVLKKKSARAPEDTNLEHIISVAATLITQIVATPANRIALVIASNRPTAINSGGGRDQTVTMLSHLAEVLPSSNPNFAGAVDQMVKVVGRPRDLIVLSTRTATDAFAQEGADQLNVYLGNATNWRWFSTADASINQIAESSETDLREPQSTP